MKTTELVIAFLVQLFVFLLIVWPVWDKNKPFQNNLFRIFFIVWLNYLWFWIVTYRLCFIPFDSKSPLFFSILACGLYCLHYIFHKYTDKINEDEL